MLLLGDLQSGHGRGEEGGNERGENTAGGDQQREHHVTPLGVQLLRHGGDDQRSARGLGEGAEQIGAHTGDITDVITDVIGNDSGVARIILGNASLDLADEISAHIGSLGVDTAAHSSEQSDGGTAQTVTRDALEQHLRGVRVLGVPRHEDSEHVDGAVQDQQTERGQAEAHDATRAEGGVETVRPGDLAHGGSTSVGVDSDGHTDVTAENGGQTTDDEGRGRGDTVADARGLVHDDPLAAVQRRIIAARKVSNHGRGNTAGLGETDEQEDDNSEDRDEDEQDLVLSPQEGLRTVRNVLLNLVETLRDGLVVRGSTTLSLHESLLLTLLGNVLHPSRDTGSAATYTTLATIPLWIKAKMRPVKPLTTITIVAQSSVISMATTLKNYVVQVQWKTREPWFLKRGNRCSSLIGARLLRADHAILFR